MTKIFIAVVLTISLIIQIIELCMKLKMFKKYSGVRKIDVLMNPSILEWLKNRDVNIHR